MKSNKIAMTAATLGLVVMLSGAVWAAGPGFGRGMGMGPGYAAQQQLTPEQAAAAQEARGKFLAETAELRKQIAAKSIDLQTLRTQPNADPAKVKALSDELIDLRAQLAKARTAVQAEYPGCPLWGTGGQGFGGGRHNRGGGMGWGPGSGACLRGGF